MAPNETFSEMKLFLRSHDAWGGTVESVPWFSVSDWSCVLVVEMRSPLISPWCFSFWIPVSIFHQHSSPRNWRHDRFSNTRFPLRGRVYRPVDFRQLCIPVCTAAHSDHTLISKGTLMWWRCRAQESRMKEDWRYQNPTHYSCLQQFTGACTHFNKSLKPT